MAAGIVWLAATPAAPAAAPDAAAATPEQLAFFEAKIRPIFVEHCWKCHAEDAKGGLRLDGREAALAGGDSGPALVPGDVGKSLIVRAVRYADPAYQMPPTGKLPAATIRAIEEWVAAGAAYPAGSGGAVVRRGEFTVSDADREHWAYRPIVRPAVPAGAAATPLDAFLEEKLAARGLTANGPATPRELVRRAWFDLVGLPPPLAEVEAFERDPSAAAWRALVERLLAMPAYGERWGRHWLDVVRFAQTNGYERDGEKPFAWRYRDWVIAAFNADMPYDRFVREQIAGDLLEPRDDGALAASGFWHLGTWDDEPDDGRLARFDELDDMIATVGQAFLGATINCARCHDHKFDPFGQKDYYALLGMINRIRRYSPKHGIEKRKKKDADGKEIEEEVRIDADAYVELGGEGGGFVMAARDAATAEPARVLVRGNPAVPGAVVEAGIPEVLRGRVPADELGDLSGRRALAAWIASPANPLAPRVMVNRIWLHHFGRPLVPTPNDFGFAGVPPVHAALLDWLAAEFVESGFSVKHLHRAIMSSAAYRRSSAAGRSECLAVDEENSLYWRQHRRRLEAEAIRDALLAAADALDSEAGGRGFFADLGRDSISGQSKPGDGWGVSDARQQRRRSVYAFVKRSLLPPELEVFDAANTTASVGERPVTTVAPQALLLTNGSFARRTAAALAARIAAEPAAASGDGDADARFVARAYERALARRPTAAEATIARGYLARQRAAWEAAADPVTLVPLVPTAIHRGYREKLATPQILAVSPDGSAGGTAGEGPGDWIVGGGVWGGGYEGILNLDPATGPLALWKGQADRPPPAGFDAEGRFGDGVVEADLVVRGAAELAALVLRGIPEGEKLGERFTGYELVFVPPLKAVELRKVTLQGMKVLAAGRREIVAGVPVPVRLECRGGTLTATVGSDRSLVLAAADPEPLARPGHAGLRTWGAALEARSVFVQPAGGDRVRIDPERPPAAAEASARARRDLCLLILNLNEFSYVD